MSSPKLHDAFLAKNNQPQRHSFSMADSKRKQYLPPNDPLYVNHKLDLSENAESGLIDITNSSSRVYLPLNGADKSQLPDRGGFHLSSSPPLTLGGIATPTQSRQLMEHRHSIFGPSSTVGSLAAGSSHFYQHMHHGSMLSLSSSRENTLNRIENLHEMRPFHLIGSTGSLTDWEKYYKTDEELSKIKNKKVRKFYHEQNELIDRYSEIDQLLDSGIQFNMLRVYGSDLDSNPTTRQGAPANIDENSNLLGGTQQEKSDVVMLAIYVNFIVNFFLLIGKVAVTLLTNSLSVVASLVDSVLDFMSTAIIWFSTRLVGRRDWKTKHLYPVGRSRLEPIGVLLFSVIIIVSFIQVGNEAIQRLLWGERKEVNLGTSSILIMALTVIVKVFCWLWCRSVNSSAVQALAQDAKTDVVFNAFSILFPLAGHLFHNWWLDPLGALLLSGYIIYSWGSTAFEHIDNLTGSAASAEERQAILYLCLRFAESIRQITALNAYHAGDRLTVEIDLILDTTLNLRDSHDIAEALQYAIETLPFVERAFVHLDYRTGNFAGHLDR